MIYLDTAATSLQKPLCVAEAVCRAMGSMGNGGRGVNDASLSAARTVYACREKLCRLFHAPDPSRVIFTCNSTEALNIAIFGLFGPGDHLISTDLEHNSVLRPLYRLEQQGAALSFLPADLQGCVDYDALPRMLRPETRGIICTHASNLTGNVLDIARVGRFAKEHGLLLVVDASQTAGSLPVDMQSMNIDVLCFTGHKSLLGPQGTGGLCVAEGVEIRPWKTGGTGVQSHLKEQPEAYPTRLEAGTLNGHGIAGLSAALDYLAELGMEKLHEQAEHCMRRFYQGVKDIPGVKIYGDFSGTRAPIVTLNIGDIDSGEVAEILEEDWNIAVRSGAHCAPRMHAALGTTEQGAVRFSFGPFNTTEEINIAIEAVRSIAEA